ncbi:hypothetical protein [Pseudoalteromonas sp. Ld20]|uniref:hypothetical protein n=1 Tax=Pseudoalteromonas sp. Ld20 TaxID=649165 RepID=UPI00386B9A18
MSEPKISLPVKVISTFVNNVSLSAMVPSWFSSKYTRPEIVAVSGFCSVKSTSWLLAVKLTITVSVKSEPAITPELLRSTPSL